MIGLPNDIIVTTICLQYCVHNMVNALTLISLTALSSYYSIGTLVYCR